MKKKTDENEEQYINFPDRYGRRELTGFAEKSR